MHKLGRLEPFAGNVTKLRNLPAASPDDLEAYIGYGPGRLSAGYWVLLLKDILHVDNFEMDGITLRSGGREGLPLKDEAADDARLRVHDRLLAERGEHGYREFRKRHLGAISPTGPERLVKIRPVEPPNPAATRDELYPPGAGGLQWRIKTPIRFLVALYVDRAGIAEGPGFRLPVRDIPYLKLMPNRTAIRRYLETA